MMPYMGLLPGTTLALLIVAAFQLRALRRSEWWLAPQYAAAGGIGLVVVELIIVVAGKF